MFLSYPLRYPLLSTVRMLQSQIGNPPLDFRVNGVRIMHSMTLRLTETFYAFLLVSGLPAIVCAARDFCSSARFRNVHQSLNQFEQVYSLLKGSLAIIDCHLQVPPSHRSRYGKLYIKHVSIMIATTKSM